MCPIDMKKTLIAVAALGGGTVNAQSDGDGLRKNLLELHRALRQEFLAEAASMSSRAPAEALEVGDSSAADEDADQPGRPPRRVIDVHCDRGQSIQRALRRRADELIIKIHGLCIENVEVRRDRVTLLGTDPGVDGIQAADNGDPRESALRIRDARRVRVENLQLTGAAWAGLQIINSNDGIAVVNARLENNARRGASVFGSTASFEDAVVTGNGTSDAIGWGILAWQSSQVTCVRCTVQGNPVTGEGVAVLSTGGSSVFVEDSTLEGTAGIVSQIGSHFSVESSTVAGTTVAASAAFNANGRITRTSVSGVLDAEVRSDLRIAGVTETGPPSFVFVAENASLMLTSDPSGPTTLTSDVFIQGFSNAQIFNGTTIGDLSCSASSDAHCDGTETKGSSNCGLCP